MADESDKRELMKFIGLNSKLGNKKVALTPRKPLDLLNISNPNNDWRTVAYEVWNYFANSTAITCSGSILPKTKASYAKNASNTT